MIEKTIKFDDFAQVDIRVGTIVSAQAPDWSEKLIKLTVNFGKEIGERTILAGIKKWYQPEELENKQSLFVVNLEPRRMGPDFSEGMLLAANQDDEGTPAVILFDNLAPAGSRLH